MIIVYNGNGSAVSVGISPSLRLDGETDEDFAARMVAAHVPSGAQYLVNPAVPDGVPIEACDIDWQAGTVTTGAAALAHAKSLYRARVDADAEAERQKYVTPGPGQTMTYLEKVEQAKAVEAMGQAAVDALTAEQGRDQFPILYSGVGIHAETLWGHAQIVIQKYEAWNDLGGAIETVREQSKKSISDASDHAAVVAAYEAITWPTPT